MAAPVSNRKAKVPFRTPLTNAITYMNKVKQDKAEALADESANGARSLKFGWAQTEFDDQH